MLEGVMELLWGLTGLHQRFQGLVMRILQGA